MLVLWSGGTIGCVPITKCRKWKKERRKLLRNLYKEGIRWQGWTERKGLAELLANEKALGPLVGFLKTTDVGRERRGESTGARIGTKK